jgi:DNA-binding protein HU-beta
MNKTDLINGMAENAGITKAAAKKALDSLLIDIEGSLQKGNRVSLVGFGSWTVTRRAAREGRNPQTGKSIQIKAKNVVKLFIKGSFLTSLFYLVYSCILNK